MTKSGSIKGKVLVSNPGKQYVHQLLIALQDKGISFEFFTSFWYKPATFPFNLISLLPGKLNSKLIRELKKRYDDKLNERFVSQFPFFEVVRECSDKLFGQRFSERMQFYRDRIHDRWVASKIRSKFSVVVGYEESCLLSFRKAKKIGLTTVLDLAQVHYKEIELIAGQYAVFANLYTNRKLRDKINRIKQEELLLADYILCLSGYAKSTLVEQGLNPEKIFVTSLGFDPAVFQAKRSYIVHEKIKVIFAGTLTRRKGIDLLLEASNELSDVMDLVLVGPMADAEDLLNLYKGKYTWYPHRNHTQLSELLQRSDLFVFPSYLDSWAMVVTEAMASGLPVVVSENTGAKEAVINGSGFIIPVGNKSILKDKIVYFYNNRNALEVMGKKAAKEASNYTWGVYHDRISSIITQINANAEK